MAHPFEKMFEKALKKSLDEENYVTQEAIRLLQKGYAHAEIRAVLEKLRKALIDEREEEIIQNTIEALDEEE